MKFKQKLEYILVRSMVGFLGVLPLWLARLVATVLVVVVYPLLGRLRRVGLRNLELALPELSIRQREEILKGVFRSLGRQLIEFCRMNRYTLENTKGHIRAEGMEHYLEARARGKGVLITTGHLGAWELSGVYLSLFGHTMSVVIRRLDNRLIDELVNSRRCLHGNRMLHKDDFGRGLLSAMRKGETVAILMDTNMTPPQGAFVDFFGREACTATGLAHMARKTGAAVLPAFMLWEETEQSWVLHFGHPLDPPHTDDANADILAITQQCTKTIEDWIRRYPDQWLWIHRRWKTRPAGEPSLYA